MAKFHNNRKQMLQVFATYPDAVVEYRRIFSTGKWFNEITFVRENTVYSMTLATLKSLVKDGTLLLVDKKEQVVGESPFSYTNRYYYYKVRVNQ